MTLYVAVTKREDYVEANSLLNGSRAFSFVAGPSVGGILVQILSAPAALLADAVSFVGSALFLTRIRAEEPPLEPADGRHASSDEWRACGSSWGTASCARRWRPWRR